MPSSRSSTRRVSSRVGSSWRIEARSAAWATPSASATWTAEPAPPDAITGSDTASDDRLRQLEVVAVPRPVGVDRREQDLTRSALLGLARPVDCAAARRRRTGPRPHVAVRRVDGDDDRLRAEARRELAHELRTLERRAVHRDLVRARLEERLGVGDRANASPDGERDRELVGDAGDEGEQRGPTLDRRLHVEVDELVGTRIRVRDAELDRDRRRRGSPWKRTPLTTRPPATSRHGIRRGRGIAARKRAPAAPLFSGWNWTPTKLPGLGDSDDPSERAVAAGVSAAYEWAK